jgi:hypothetical protein
MDLKKLIMEVLEGKECCTATKPTKAPILNESLAPREILSEGLQYHIDNKKPLTEHVYRAGSTNYFHLWAEARSLYTRGILDFSGDDLAILTETQLGEFGMYEGKKVPLDFIMEEENIEEIKLTASGVMDLVRRVYKDAKLLDFLDFSTFKDFVEFIKTGDFNDYEDIKNEVEQYDKQLAEGQEYPFEYKGFKYNVEVLSNTTNDRGQKLYKISIENIGSYNEYTNERDAHIDAKREIDDQLIFEGKSKPKKKTPELNKPKRGGSKKFYVYVRDPKTKNIKKVSFGDTTGLSAKINNPTARQAFSKRHDCPNKKDKTKASYWSCRLPRYAKLLGLKSNFSGFW